MQGTFRDPATRALMRDHWAKDIVPHLVKDETAPLRKLLRNTGELVAIDVGANKGFWAKALLNAFPNEVRRIYMIDASPENYKELSDREDNMMFTRREFGRLSAHHFAAGDAPGEATLHTNDEGSPLASLYAHDLNGYSHEAMRVLDLTQSVVVPVRTLDSFIQDQAIAHVDILKLDVEGHELPALMGAAESLGRGLVDTLAFEFGMHQVESRHFFMDFFKFLDGLKFDLFLARGGDLEPIPRYEYKYENFTDNFIIMGRRR